METNIENTAAPSVEVPRLVRLDVLTPEFLYKALRPDASWDINADKPHWEYEAWKLQSAIIRHLDANKVISDSHELHR